MSKLDEFEKELRVALEADKSGVQHEINTLQSQVDCKYSELGFEWKCLGGGILVWALDLIIAIAIGNAENIITVLFILLSFLIIYIGGAALAIATIVVLFSSISKWLTISSLRSKISSNEENIRKLNNDLAKVSKT